jgi:hypothetical protein
MSMHRRGRGEGSIVQRADGRWMARVDLGWQDGKRRSKAIYGRTRRAVADALQNALRAAQDGTLVADERQTVPAFLARWLQDVARTRVRPRTFGGTRRRSSVISALTSVASACRETDTAASSGVDGDPRVAGRLCRPASICPRRVPNGAQHGHSLGPHYGECRNAH